MSIQKLSFNVDDLRIAHKRITGKTCSQKTGIPVSGVYIGQLTFPKVPFIDYPKFGKFEWMDRGRNAHQTSSGEWLVHGFAVAPYKEGLAKEMEDAVKQTFKSHKLPKEKCNRANEMYDLEQRFPKDTHVSMFDSIATMIEISSEVAKSNGTDLIAIHNAFDWEINYSKEEYLNKSKFINTYYFL